MTSKKFLRVSFDSGMSAPSNAVAFAPESLRICVAAIKVPKSKNPATSSPPNTWTPGPVFPNKNSNQLNPCPCIEILSSWFFTSGAQLTPPKPPNKGNHDHRAYSQ